MPVPEGYGDEGGVWGVADSEVQFQLEGAAGVCAQPVFKAADFLGKEVAGVTRTWG